jgi:hypothetical protein
MPGYVVDSASMIKCLHGIPAPLAPMPRVLLSGSPVTTVPPTGPRMGVAPGCPFQVPVGAGTKPQPCVTIDWANVSTRVTVLGQPLYLQALPPAPGNGICKSAEQISQGVPSLGKLQLRVVAT